MSAELPEVLSDWWTTHVGDLPTIPHMLRDWLPGRWVRFHSLPNSKRYATTDEERAILLARHHALIDELFDAQELAFVYSAGRYSGASSSGVVASAVPWKTLDFSQGRGNEGEVQLRCMRVRQREIDELVMNVAEERWSECLIVQPDRPAFLHPYDGGIDVFLETPAIRDELRIKHAEWLSNHPKGL